MKPKLAALVLAALALLPGGVQADPFDDLIRNEMAARRIPGVALKVIERGVEVKSACYGFANLELAEPVGPDTVFEIGSVTKQFTAAGILLLQQQGKLSIEERITQHLTNSPAAWTNVTIRQLLNHTSGIKSYTGLDGFEWRRRLTQAQFIEAMANYPLEFSPGDAWKYSNSGYSLLGYIIANASGAGYWQFLDQNIFQPLGMKLTQVRDPGVIITNRAHGYEQTNRVHINRDYDLTDVFAAGALVSTTGDLAKWNAALDSTNLLSAASKALMWQRATLNNGQPTRYGLGWYVETIEGRSVNGHGGSTSGFSASIQRFEDGKLTVIILTNTDEMVATSLARKVAALRPSQ